MKLVFGDILSQDVDCIVNPANSLMHHAGGLARAIIDAAGPEVDEETRAIVGLRGEVPAGQAILSGAGKLPFKGIIHAVGPRWGDGEEEFLLACAYGESLKLAFDQGWDSIAFPAISCGIFGFPVSLAAPIAVNVLSMSPLKSLICVLDEDHHRAFQSSLLSFESQSSRRINGLH